MKTKNFPGRKYQRIHAARARANGEAGASSADIKIPDSVRSIRTKKDRS